ncbi:hypothetical protein NPIL_598101 [Nephila pilipes]|uniref:Uncharacterized protein n=1 Tax=Nephila pilipes TaxID=299642 RepID=A0A8X6PE79_NEPPI|nr:hypothetical protein NPIL_598101 [Nephila pilipes]
MLAQILIIRVYVISNNMSPTDGAAVDSSMLHSRQRCSEVRRQATSTNLQHPAGNNLVNVRDRSDQDQGLPYLRRTAWRLSMLNIHVHNHQTSFNHHLCM